MRAFWILFLFLISFSLVGCIYKKRGPGGISAVEDFGGFSHLKLSAETDV